MHVITDGSPLLREVPILKRIRPVLLSLLLIAAACGASPYLGRLSSSHQEMALHAPWVIFAAGGILSIYFHRGRPFLAFLLLSCLYLLFRLFGGVDRWQLELLPLLLLLIPANLALLSFLRERGVFSMAGRLRFGFLAAQFLASAWLARFDAAYAPLFRYLHWPVFPNLPLTGLPQLPLATAVLAAAVTGGRALITGSAVDRGIFASAAGVLTALVAGERVFGVPAVLAATGIALGWALLKESYRLAFVDDLTGLPGRRALMERFQGLGKRYVIAMVDVDHFKSFNDRYGHDVGDQVLKIVAAQLAEVKGDGTAFRYGGEEFTIVFSGKTARESIPHLDAVRRGIESYPFRVRGKDRPKDPEKGSRKRHADADGDPVTVTVSIGIAECVDRKCDPHEVMKAADKALYRAKSGGRNRLSR